MSETQIRRGEGLLPEVLQGRWVDVDDPNSELVIDGFDVVYGGKQVQHDFARVSEVSGALCVDLGIDADDVAAVDTFAGANVTNLVIDPEGICHAYNVKFAATFERRNRS